MIPNLTEDAKRLFEKGKFLYPDADLDQTTALMDLYKVVSIGFAIDGYDEGIKKFPIWEKARSEIASDGAISSGTWGEISTIAILSKICEMKLSPIQTSTTKTPDFLAVVNGSEAEIESTKASRKALQMEMSQKYNDICREISSVKQDGIDAVVHIGNGFEQSDKEEILNFYKSNGANKVSKEVKNRYHASISDPAFPQGVIMSGDHQVKNPSWFNKSDDLVNQFCFDVKVSSDTSVNYGQTRILFQTKVNRYMDPVKRKMAAFQGSGTRPFILFLDVTNLPKAIDIYSKKAGNFLSKYEMLSCLVVFNNLLGFETCGFNFIIIENASARFPVKFIESGIVEFGRKLSVSCKLIQNPPA